MTKLGEFELNKIYCMDCLEGLKKIPDSSVDLVITDPPYNVLALEWDKQEVDFKIVAKELFRVLKDYGSLYIFCQMPIGFKIYNEFSKLFEFRQDLIWAKNRGISLTRTVYMRKHENILYFIKDDKEKWLKFGRYLKEKRKEKKLSIRKCQRIMSKELEGFHFYKHGGGGWLWFETGRPPTLKEYNYLKQFFKLDNRFDKELFNSHEFNFDEIKEVGKPYYKTRRNNPIIYGKKSGMGHYVQTNDGSRCPSSVLNYNIIQSGKEYVGHPTQKPIAMIRYLAKASSNEGDIVLDCFMGSGTTAFACKQLKRNFIGFEINPEYVKIANKRLAQEVLVL